MPAGPHAEAPGLAGGRGNGRNIGIAFIVVSQEGVSKAGKQT